MREVQEIKRVDLAETILDVVGAVDIDPEKAGRNLSAVIGLHKRLRVTVTSDLAGALKATRPDVVLHCTSSSLKTVVPQLATILKSKTPVVSTTEELSYPWYSNRRLAREVDALAKFAREDLEKGLAGLARLFQANDKKAIRKALLRLRYLDKFAEEARARRANLK